MTDPVLNRSMLPGNACFGCGHENEVGLHIEIRRDPTADDRLIGTFTPTSRMTGFPGVVHGGALYTALDCLATWVATVMRPEKSVVWILRSADVTYHRVAREGKKVSLDGRISVAGDPWKPLVVQAQAYDEDGELLAEGYFKEVPLELGRFRERAGVKTIPPNWNRFLQGSTSEPGNGAGPAPAGA